MCQVDLRNEASEPEGQDMAAQRPPSQRRPEADAERFGAVFHASPEPILLIDPQQMTLLDVNAAVCAALNHTSPRDLDITRWHDTG